MRRARKGKITLLFADAAHFVLGGDYLSRIYGRTRRYVKTFSGRLRYNVLGVLNYISKKVTTVTNDTYITTTEVCELLRKVATEYMKVPIFMVLDNARYQKSIAVKELAKELNIQLVFIPAYSPNLNLIERLWKFVKSRLRSRYYSQFTKEIDKIIDSTHTNNRYIIDRLIGRGVQLFNNLTPITSNSFLESSHKKAS